MPKSGAVTCPALENLCPDCPAISLCELVAGGWEIAYTAPLEGMPEPEPEPPPTLPTGLTAPVESRLAPPEPPRGPALALGTGTAVKSGPVPAQGTAAAVKSGPALAQFRPSSGPVPAQGRRNRQSEPPRGPAIRPSSGPGPEPDTRAGKRRTTRAAMQGADVAGIAQMTPAAAYGAGYRDCAAGLYRRRRIYQGEGPNAYSYAEGWYAAARARWQARH